VLGVSATRWHLAATYFQDKGYWRLHLWDVQPG
jgi:hypothetical protein